MSKYNTIETEYRDAECLVQALNDVGYTDVEINEIAQNLYGYHGDLRQQKAHIIVRRKNIGPSANDLGFLRNENGSYSMIVSDYDQGKHNAKWQVGLKCAYGERGALKVAKKKGFRYLGKTLHNGKIQYKFQDRKGA
jgi:hypothetical protein